ncbi:MAG: polyprenyl synthetase family protein [Flavobacteriales bacterium]|nr:polyprenyl synthetase family protein [Flavobacteriales bacterium]
MKFFTEYLELINKEIENNKFSSEPTELYEPLNYMLANAGKRIRPVMTLMACDLFGGDKKLAIRPALALEYFHNFTLIHDDVMDEAPLRRGKETVHKRYDLNTAILSGDALLIKSYQFFEQLPAELYKTCTSFFSKTAIEVCEGQQYDINFETQEEVSFDEYYKMIEYKTGVLGACAFKIGAVISKASEENTELIYQYGLNLAKAFQIMDDYLDVFGSQENFGKKVAGDIYENKKTILYLLALEKGSKEDIDELKYWYSNKTRSIDKIFAVERIFKRLAVDEIALELVAKYNTISFEYLEKIEVEKEKKQPFYDLSNYLLNRVQ